MGLKPRKPVVRKGDRVGAIAEIADGAIFLFGYGVYEGKHVPHDVPGLLARLCVAKKFSVPRIRLDSGDVVWGVECWWDAEAHVRSMETSSGDVHYVSIAKQRELLEAPRGDQGT